ncbi:MAG: sulfur transferase domain-containing protein [Planctomycetota bacterium]
MRAVLASGSLACALLCSCASTQDATPAQAAELETFAHGNLFFSGQPKRADLQRLVTSGEIARVLSCRSEAEMANRERVPFDQEAYAESIGLEYAFIGTGGSDGYSPEKVDAFAEWIESSDEPALVHCASGGRAKYLYLAYLVRHRGYSPDEALALGRDQLGLNYSVMERLTGYEFTQSVARPLPEPEPDRE